MLTDAQMATLRRNVKFLVLSDEWKKVARPLKDAQQNGDVHQMRKILVDVIDETLKTLYPPRKR